MLVVAVKISLDFIPPRPNKAKALKIVHIQIQKLWRDSVRSFLRAVALEGIIKVRSGMSMASLLPLARSVRMMSAIQSKISSERVREKFRPYYPGGKGTSAQGLKSIAHGNRLGEDAFIFETGTPQTPVFIFEFEIRVFHYFINENGLGPTPAWNSLKIGREAFLQTFRAGLLRINLGGLSEALYGR